MQSIMRKAPHNFGFTIIEVMISIAIALLLILGINQVFSIAQQTSGAGTTALAAVENARAAHSVMQKDFDSAVTGSDAPAIVIISEPIFAWRNKQDMLNSHAPAATRADLRPGSIDDPRNPNVQIPQSLTAINSRVHRIDRIMFFTRGTQPRQTANPGGFVSPTAWLESYVWYGHLALPKNNYVFNNQYLGPRPGTRTPNDRGTSDFYNPGDPANQNNYFASDWVLGRVPIVLVPFATPDGSGNPEITLAAGATGLSTPLSLLGGGSGSGQGAGNTAPAQAYQQNTVGPTAQVAPAMPIYSSRYDMAYASIDAMRAWVASSPVTFPPPLWWQQLSGFTLGQFGQRQVDVRFEADPFPQRPQNLPANQIPLWASAVAARQAPVFLRGCSQFIVEYAGDFITQDDDPSSRFYGQPRSAQPDGQIDYVVVNVGTPNNPQLVKRVRWYGFPRDVDGDGRVTMQNDVVPLRDLIATLPNNYGFERQVNFTLPLQSDYGNPNSVRLGECLVAAWGADQPLAPKPKMIRITIALDDPSGRLNSEQYFEYVFNLP